jgi:hexosaminidase
MTRSPWSPWSFRAWAGCVALAVLSLVTSPSARAQAEPSAPTLRWEVVSVMQAAGGSVSTQARFVLEAGAAQGLARTGWALYFSCIGEVEAGSAEPPFVVEPVVGTLYRVRPGAGFAGLAPGQTLAIALRHPGVMQLTDRAPQGPYFVFDADADRALPPSSYRVEVPVRPEQLGARPGQALPGPTAQALYHQQQALHTSASAAVQPIFPTPLRYEPRPGAVTWRTLPRIDAPAELNEQAGWARSLLAPFVAAGQRRGGEPPLRLRVGAVPGQSSPEAYTLTIAAGEGVTLLGASNAAVARGLATLRSLLPNRPSPRQGLRLPAMQVIDAPRFEYRGLMLDVARHFHPKDTVLRLLDTMAALKLNVLHLHLTDDEGWRLAITGLPELTDFGARRGHSADPWRHLPPAHGSGPDAARSSGSGHYSADDYIEILRHAARHGIDVIPELEMPGHARAAVKAMELRSRRLAAAGDAQADRYRLSDPHDRSQYRSAQLYTDNVMNPALPSTYTFIEHVLDELVALHRRAGVPLRHLHIGADELPGGAWSGSPAAKALIDRLGLAGLPGLWEHFYDRVIALLEARGIRPAAWEELGSRRANADGSGPLVPNPRFAGRRPTLYVWNNLDDAHDLAYRLANTGYPVVLSPVTALYFDMAHSARAGEPGVNWAATTDLRAVFDYDPLNAPALTEAGRRNIVGLQANLFTEVMPTRARLEGLMLPRLFAMAERAWAAEPMGSGREGREGHAPRNAQWAGFVHQLGTRLLPALQRDQPGVQWHLPAPGLLRDGRVVRVSRAWPGLTVRYTLDGTEPNASSPIAASVIQTASPVRAATFDARGRRSLTSHLGGP